MDNYDDLIFAASDQYKIDPMVLKGLLFQESKFDPQARSKAGAIGIAQFMPETAKEVGIDPTDPEQSIFGAAFYLRQQADRFDGDIGKGLAAYNAGGGRVKSLIDTYGDAWVDNLPAETSDYLSRIAAHTERFDMERGATPKVEPVEIAPPTQTSAIDPMDVTVSSTNPEVTAESATPAPQMQRVNGSVFDKQIPVQPENRAPYSPEYLAEQERKAKLAANAKSTIGPSTFDFDTANKFKNASLGRRAIEDARYGLASAGGGMLEFMAEAGGFDNAADYISAVNKDISGSQKALGDNPNGYLANMAEKTLSQAIQQAPGWISGVGLANMVGQSFGREYAESRQYGLDFADATKRAASMAVAEGLGEKLGIKSLRAVGDSVLAKEGADQLATALARHMLREQSGEAITHTLQFGTDKLASFGLNPEATLKEYIEGLRDTVVQTAMMVGGMGAGGKIAREGMRDISGERVATEVAELARQNALAKWRTEGFSQPKRDPVQELAAKPGPAATAETVLAAAEGQQTMDKAIDAAMTITGTKPLEIGPTEVYDPDSPPVSMDAQLSAVETLTGGSPAPSEVQDAPTDIPAAQPIADGSVEPIPAEAAPAQRSPKSQADINAGLAGIDGIGTDASGNPTINGTPVLAVEESDLPDAAVARGGAVSRQGGEALNKLYGVAGKRVVFYQDNPNLPDGYVAPNNPDVIFLSNNPQKAAVFVAAHEVVHTFEDSGLYNVLTNAVGAGLTKEGWAYAKERFSSTLPKGATERQAYEHYVKEMTSDIGGWAQMRRDFQQKVFNEIEVRHGKGVLKQVMEKFIASLDAAIKKVQAMFAGRDKDRSEEVVTNLREVHSIMAKIYADRFGKPHAEAMRKESAEIIAKTPTPPATGPPAKWTREDEFNLDMKLKEASDAMQAAKTDQEIDAARAINAEAERMLDRKLGRTTPDLDAQAQAAATSKKNDLPQPTAAQKEAGNYQKGHVVFQGLPISIENPVGSVRSGVSKNGNKWSRVMKSHYGYIKGTKGADKDHIDVFIGKDHGSQRVFVVDQKNADGSFDEHKVLVGFSDLEAAKNGYLENYTKGWKGMGAITQMSMPKFREWLQAGDTKKPLSYSPKAVDKKETPKQTSEEGQRAELETFANEPKDKVRDRAATKQTETPAFKAWFGNSKVVDAEGKPLVVYHGTTKYFDTFKSNKEGLYGWFTPDANYASKYPTEGADFARDGQNVMPVFLKIENPISIDEMREIGVEEAIRRGHDGIVSGGKYHKKSYATFRPEQIKSAIGNRGTFDPADPNILFSPKQSDPLYDAAKKFFGTTKSFKEAGYIMQDGDMLDFSGRHYAQDHPSLRNQRSVDHRELTGENSDGFSMDDLFERTSGSGSEYMAEFMKRTGAMRVDFNVGVASIMDVPTAAQIKQLGDGLFGEYAVVSYIDADSQRIVDEKEFERATPQALRRFFDRAVAKEVDPRAPLFSPKQNTEAFIRWFGDSKVVDDEGKPLMVYHGSVEQGLDKPTVENASEVSGVVTFTDNIDVADQYRYPREFGEIITSEYDEESGEEFDIEPGDLIKAYLRIERPMVVDFEGDVGDAIRVGKLVKEAKAIGHDGLIIKNIDDTVNSSKELGTSYFVFDNDQIFPTDQELQFSPKQPSLDITPEMRDSVMQGQPLFSPKKPSLNIPEETALQAKRRRYQDKFLRFQVIQDWLKENNLTISEDADVYMAEGLYHGRAATRIEDFREKKLKPIVTELNKAGFTLADAELALHAQHAEERNMQIAKINPKMPDGGSGMMTADARAILAKLDPKLLPLANKLRALTDETRDMLLKAGIIDQGMVNAWVSTYKHYVPLKGGDEVVQTGTGKGMDVNGKMKRAMGHSYREELIVENIIRDYERAVLIAEKNRVGQHLLQLAIEANRPDLITIGKPEKRAVLVTPTPVYEVRYQGGTIAVLHNKQDAIAEMQYQMKTTGMPAKHFAVVKSIGNPSVQYQASSQLAENEARVYLNGQMVRIQLNDPLLAQAYKNLGVDHLVGVFKVAREVNAWLSKAYTGYNPEFVTVNVLRDAIAGTINLTGDYGVGVTAKVVANYPAQFLALMNYAKFGKATKLIADYRADGGSTGAAYLGDLERISKDVKTLYNDVDGVFGTARREGILAGARVAADKTFVALAHVIEVFNRAGENAMRLATYKTLREEGASRAKAAMAAKDVTVNFNRKGEIGSHLSALYLFYNPNVQGTAKLLHTLLASEHRVQAWALVATIPALFYALAAWNADEDKDRWDKTPQYDKNRNIIIPWGKDQVKIPFPYGYGFFASLGNAIHDLANGKKPKDVAWHLADAFASNFSPIGNPIGESPDAKNLVQVMPFTPMKIGAEIITNRTGLGGPVYPENQRIGKPDSSSMFRTTKGGVWDWAAQAANKATGGNQAVSGWVDVHPDSLAYLWRAVTGGTGAFVTDSAQLGWLAAQGIKPEVREVPILRKFLREPKIGDTRRKFWEAAKEIKEAQGQFATAKANLAEMRRIGGPVEDQAERTLDLVKEETQLLRSMGGMLRKFEELADARRDEVDAILANKKLTLEERRLKAREIEVEEARLYDTFIQELKDRRAGR